MPIPTSNIVHLPYWKESVFKDYDIMSTRFQVATDMFERKWSNTSAGTYLEMLALEENPSRFLLRSNINCIKYRPIEDSLAFLID